MKALVAAIFAVALTATVVSAQVVTTDERGRFVRYDQAAQVIVLDDGRMYRVTPSTVVLVDNRPVAYNTLQPGQTIIVRAAQPVVYQNGLYTAVGPSGAPEAPPSSHVTPSSSTVVVTPPPAPTTAVAPPPPPAAVTPAPPATTTVVPAPPTTTVVTAPATQVRRTMYGTVTDVDRNEIKVRTDRGSFEVPLMDARNSGIRKGDTVQFDMTVTPSGSPAARRR
jgi:hypothetical protein